MGHRDGSAVPVKAYGTVTPGRPDGFDRDAWDEGWVPCDDPPFPDGCHLELIRPGKTQCDCDDQGGECLDCGLPMFDDWFVAAAKPGAVPGRRAAHPPAFCFGYGWRCGTHLATGKWDPWGRLP